MQKNTIAVACVIGILALAMNAFYYTIFSVIFTFFGIGVIIYGTIQKNKPEYAWSIILFILAIAAMIFNPDNLKHFNW